MMNFENLYKVMVKNNGEFIPTGRAHNGEVTLESDISKQCFYASDVANKLKESLEEAGIEAKVVKAF